MELIQEKYYHFREFYDWALSVSGECSWDITKTGPYNIQMKKLKIFRRFLKKKILIFAQNIDCGYLLEPPRRGGSNKYPQSMFWSKKKKNRYTPP